MKKSKKNTLHLSVANPKGNLDLSQNLSDFSIEYFDSYEEDQRILNEFSNKTKADGEDWRLFKTETLKSNVTLSGNCGDLVAKSTSATVTKGVNLSIKNDITLFGIKVNAGFSYTKTHSLSGPGDKSPLGNNSANGHLTHNAPVAFTKGSIKRYTYKVYNKYSGNYIRTEVQTAAVRSEAFSYTIGVQQLTNAFKAENSVGTKYKTYSSLSDYKSKLSNVNNTVNMIQF